MKETNIIKTLDHYIKNVCVGFPYFNKNVKVKKKKKYIYLFGANS